MAGHANVEKIEFRRPRDDRARATRAERLDEDTQKRIDEYLKILAHGLGIDAAVPGDVAVVQKLSMAEREGVEEPRECRCVPRQPFVEHLLFQVVVHVAGKRASVSDRVVVLRDQPPVERPQQVKIRDLRPGQGIELETPGAAAQQVGAAAPQLPGAGAAQHEAQALVLHEPMNLIQNGRRLLHLVDDDGVRARCAVECGHAFRERLWRPRELQQEPGIEQVEPGGFREQPAKQCRFPGLARSPQESGLSLRKVNAEGQCGRSMRRVRV